jgi:hypothetical protein
VKLVEVDPFSVPPRLDGATNYDQRPFLQYPQEALSCLSNIVSHGYIGQWWLPVFIIGGADLHLVSLV